MTNALSRPLPLVVCLLLALALPGLSASAQVLPQNIIQANQIGPEERQIIAQFIDPAMAELISGEPERVAQGRETLIRPLRNESASTPFREAYSEMVTDRMEPAAAHQDVLVRLNMMMVMEAMVDADSVPMMIAGLSDQSVGVQRRAMQALNQRAAWWQSDAGANPGEVRNLVQQTATFLNANPDAHPVVVGPAMDMLFDMNTALSRQTLVDQLNARVALHAADPNLSYAAEQGAIFRYAQEVFRTRPFNRNVARDVARANYRYAEMIVNQLQNDAVNNINDAAAIDMLSKCLRGMELILAASGKRAPGEQQTAIEEWIPEREWENVAELIEGPWNQLLSAAPFSLTAEELAVAPEETGAEE